MSTKPLSTAIQVGIHGLGALGLSALIVGHYWGLYQTPPDSHMGDVVKILFVHVPCAWNCMFVFTIAFVAALVSLVGGFKKADCVLAGALEVGILLTALTLVTGSIFAHPTWGVWWTSDPRLNSTAIMFLTFNSDEKPFPFDEWPTLEPSDGYSVAATKVADNDGAETEVDVNDEDIPSFTAGDRPTDKDAS